MKKVKIKEVEYDLEDKDAALIEVLQDLVLAIRTGGLRR